MTKIFLDYDQHGLDRAYDQRAWAANMEDVLAEYATASEQARKRLGRPTIYSYGPTPIERVEVFQTSAPLAPVLIFIHGGAWRRGTAADYSFLAEMFVDAGVNYVAVDFTPVTTVDGDLRAVASQVTRAIAWVGTHAERFGGNPDRVYLAGHSSGAHLAAAAVTADWTELGATKDILKGALLISGMYDLRPVRLSARNSYVRLDDTSEAALSPARHLSGLDVPLIVAWGSKESPEFIRQGQAFVSAGKALAKHIEGIQVNGLNHFEILKTLAQKQSSIGRAALDLIGSKLSSRIP